MNLVSLVDVQIEMFLFGIRTPLLVSVFSWITVLGESLLIIASTGLLCAVLWRSTPHRAYAVGLAIAVFGAGISGTALKLLVGRARPSGVLPVIAETSYSFPSMHATLSMAFYGFTAYMLCRLFPAKKPLILTLSMLLIGVIGVSRLYLGVHFPSDVLAGFILGGLWIVGSIRIIKMFYSAQTV